MTLTVSNQSARRARQQWQTRMTPAEHAAGATQEAAAHLRFWSHVPTHQIDQPDACWEWEGARSAYGYGRAHRTGHDGAHRVSWMLTHGPVAPGLHVCHRCDNPPCVNPSHLFLGTPSANHLDRRDKGRQHGLRLNRAEVVEIRTALNRGALQKTLAAQHHVSPATISAIATGANWADVR